MEYYTRNQAERLLNVDMRVVSADTALGRETRLRYGLPAVMPRTPGGAHRPRGHVRWTPELLARFAAATGLHLPDPLPPPHEVPRGPRRARPPR